MAATLLSDRALVRLSGDDPRGFLQGLVTSDVAGPLPVWAGLLSAQGKALFDFLLWADGEDVLIDCERAQADALARRLSLYRLRRHIAIERDEALGVHWAADAGGAEGVPDPRLPALGRRWIAPAGDAVPAPPPADAAWRGHRLSLGVAEGVAEIGQDRTLWLEANAAELGGVSFTKGCYVGQENTARMNWRQKVNRRLFVVRIGQDPPESLRVGYPDIGLGIVHKAVDKARGDPDIVRPEWLGEALTIKES